MSSSVHLPVGQSASTLQNFAQVGWVLLSGLKQVLPTSHVAPLGSHASPSAVGGDERSRQANRPSPPKHPRSQVCPLGQFCEMVLQMATPAGPSSQVALASKTAAAKNISGDRARKKRMNLAGDATRPAGVRQASVPDRTSTREDAAALTLLWAEGTPCWFLGSSPVSSA